MVNIDKEHTFAVSCMSCSDGNARRSVEGAAFLRCNRNDHAPFNSSESFGRVFQPIRENEIIVLASSFVYVIVKRER